MCSSQSHIWIRHTEFKILLEVKKKNVNENVNILFYIIMYLKNVIKLWL